MAEWEPGPPPSEQRPWGKKQGSAWLGRAGVGGGKSENRRTGDWTEEAWGLVPGPHRLAVTIQDAWPRSV